MRKKPVNDTSVRIPAHAHGILFAEKTRILLEDKKKVGIGTLAGQYIERGELFEEAIDGIRAVLVILNEITVCVDSDSAEIYPDSMEMILESILTKYKALP